jgi:hypothetical protein
MSRHEVSNEQGKIVYGWDRMLNSFYLQIHDSSQPEDDNPIVWLGSSGDSIMHEVSDLVRAAQAYGIVISYPMQRVLYGDKDEGL